jgi:protein TonB
MANANPYAYASTDGSRRTRGIAVALLVHVALAWLLISGTARKGLELLATPLQAVVIQAVVIAPPPPPQVKQVPLPAKPQQTPVPPPPYIPPPEQAMTAPSTLVVQATAVAHEAPPPQPTPAPVAPVAAAAAPAKLDMAIVCPVQVPPEMPRRALMDGTQGLVKAQVRIVDGAVRDVVFLSGPRIFYAAIRTAVLQYRCTRDSGEVVATQDFNFRVAP